MNQLKTEINGDTTISEAIDILKQQAGFIANSDEAKIFGELNPSWSTLFRPSYKPYDEAVEQYEEALRISEWLNGKNPENKFLTIEETFLKMSDQTRLSLFVKRIATTTPGLFDEWLKAWWSVRY